MFIEVKTLNDKVLVNINKIVKIVKREYGCSICFNNSNAISTETNYEEIQKKIADSLYASNVGKG